MCERKGIHDKEMIPCQFVAPLVRDFTEGDIAVPPFLSHFQILIYLTL
jgi:hypothetical protein